jgi:hypothetical protein
MAAGATVLLAAAVGGCGSGGGSSSSGASSSTSGSTSTKKAGHPKPIGAPPQKETFADAQKRIEAAVASGSCDKINKLNPLSLPGLANSKRCAYLKRHLEGRKPTGGQSFKGLAGVLDYQTRKRHYTAVLLRDADGLYHIAYFDPFHNAPTAGSPFAPEFKDVARASFDALRAKNCDAYLKVVYARSGPGSKGRKKVCPHVAKNPIAKAVAKFPKAKPKLIGGNRFFAFYGLDTRRYFTFVLAREAASQRPTGLKPGVLELPKGVPEYAFFRAYTTNERKPPS